MKKNLIIGIFGSFALSGMPSFAQQAPVNKAPSELFDKTDIGACLELYEQLSTKREGKATAYRLIGTRTTESNQLIDTQKIWYSHEFGSKVIPPMTNINQLTSTYAYDGTLFDSVVRFVPDPQNPGQLNPEYMLGYSINSDLLPDAYYYKYLSFFSRTLYAYNTAKQLVSIDEDRDAGGNWNPTTRETRTYAGNVVTSLRLTWNSNTSKWDSTFRTKTWLNANSAVDSTYRENFSNGNWVLFNGQAYDYNANGQITRVARYNYVPIEMALKLYDMEVWSYDGGGKIISEIRHTGVAMNYFSRNLYHYTGTVLDSIDTDTWNGGNSSWNDGSVTVFSYNSGLLTKKETFVTVNGNIHPSNKLEFSSDANQNISYSGYFIWNLGSQSYIAGVKHYYTYESYFKSGVSVLDIEEDGMTIYPNPTNGLFQVEIPFDGGGSYKVFSLDGKEVYSSAFGSLENSVLPIDLKAKTGVYFIVLTDDSGRSYSGKVAIE